MASKRWIKTLACARFLKWRLLARLGYDPMQQIRTISLREGLRTHWRVAGRSR